MTPGYYCLKLAADLREAGQGDKGDSYRVLLDEMRQCERVLQALDGKDAVVESKFASELGEHGTAYFTNGKLWFLAFHVAAPYEEVVADMKHRFRSSPTKLGQVIKQNGFGAILAERRAVWVSYGITAIVHEMLSFQHGYLATHVSVADSAIAMRIRIEHEATRPNTLD